MALKHLCCLLCWSFPSFASVYSINNFHTVSDLFVGSLWHHWTFFTMHDSADKILRRLMLTLMLMHGRCFFMLKNYIIQLLLECTGQHKEHLWVLYPAWPHLFLWTGSDNLFKYNWISCALFLPPPKINCALIPHWIYPLYSTSTRPWLILG